MAFIRCIKGSIHQGDKTFRSAGTQCTAIAFFAIVSMFVYNQLGNADQHPITDIVRPMSVMRLEGHDVDNIIIEGNKVYEQIIQTNNLPDGLYLSHNDLPDFIDTNLGNVQTSVYIDMLYGVVGQNTYDQGNGAISFYDAINTGFQVSDFLICTFNELTVASMVINGEYYIFDSHSRDIYGNVADNGTGILLQFSDMETLHMYLRNMYYGSVFNLSPVVLSINFQDNEIENTAASMVLNETRYEKNSKVIGDNILSTEDRNKLPFSSTDLVNMYNDEKYYLKKTMSSIDIETHINVERYEKCISNNHSYVSLKRRKTAKKISGSCKTFEQGSVSNTLLFEQNFDIICLSHYGEEVAKEEIVKTEINKIQVATNLASKTNKIRYDPSTAFFTEIQSVSKYICKSCDKFLFSNQIHTVNFKNELLSQLNICMGNETCSFCYHAIKNGNIPCINTKYNLLCPGSIPKSLVGLSLMEKRLISKIHVFLTVIILPGGQFAEKGIAIDFPVNIEQNINTLPHAFGNCNIITVSYGENNDMKPTHIVRKTILFSALNWLKKNNKIYKNITFNTQILSQIPCNMSDFTSSDQLDFDEFGTINIDYNLPEINIEHIIDKTKHMKLPKCTSAPVNAYDIEKGEESAFPYLFPIGSNGYNEKRFKKISLSQYFYHKLYFKDGRFRKDIPYLMHAVNYYEYQRLLNCVNIHMRMRKSSGSDITVKDLNNLNENSDILKNSYMFMKLLRGTAAYWKNILLNLLSMFKSLGPPSLFVTLSANDMHWPDLIMNLKNCSFEEACNVLNALNLVKKDPFLTATHFQRRFKSLLKNIIFGPLQPLGKVIDHFARIEFQNRGSPHVHIFFWIENFSNVYSNSDKLIEYIDSVISTSGVDKNARKFQTHKHSDYCLRQHGNCRFGFPYRQCNHTKLLNNIDIVSDLMKGRFYELKRRNADTYINAYNPTILNFWQANMDIQIIGNAESAAYYVCAYLCKSEPEDLKIALSELINNMLDDISQRQRMLKIGCCVLKTRRLSAQEAAYRLSDLNLIFSSRSFVSLNTKPPNKRYKVLKPKSERNELADNSTDVFCHNLVDYYRCRPYDFENYCLYEFAQWYVKCPKPISSNKSVGRKMETRINLLPPFQDIYMRKRTRSFVIRTPKLELASDDYFYSLLMLYLPHRKENDILKSSDSVFLGAKDAFIAKKNNMILDSLFSFSLIDEIENAVRFIRCTQIEISASLHPATIELEDVCEEISNISVPTTYNFFEEFNNNDVLNTTHENSDIAELHSIQVCMLSPDQIHIELEKLTNCQKKVMQFVMNHFKSNNYKQNPFHIFITGGGGVGKSHLLRLLIDWLRCCTSRIMGVDPVLVCAPTGTAAKNINGKTLHNALHLPVQHGYQPLYVQLSAKSLKKLRYSLLHVHTLIIDEISMVSSVMLEHIHKRLCSIKDSDDYFGGLNVITVGDFFQLRPVRGHYAFSNKYLWSDLFKPFFLNENVRQSGNQTFSDILTRARVGCLNKENITVLNTRVLPVPDDKLTKVIHLFPKNMQVKSHNDKVQASLKENSATVYAKHYFSNHDMNPKGLVDDECIPDDDRDAGGLPNILKISVGTRIMLVRNIYSSKGLVNGALGQVTYIERNERNVSLICVKFDDSNIGKMFQVAKIQNSNAIEPISQEFHFNGRIIVREQFPLIPSWACTIHKLQGASLDTAAISIGTDIFQDGMAYVALSRVTSLQGLYLLSFTAQKVKASPKVLKEYERLRNLK